MDDRDRKLRAARRRVYRALADFGAPLEASQVKAQDFANYNGVLEVALPPRHIDILMTEPLIAVFLSAHRMCDALGAEGMEVWFDRSKLRSQG